MDECISCMISPECAMEPSLILPPVLPAPISHSKRNNNKQQPVQAISAERMPLGEAAKLEMQYLPSKTPVSVLQELLSRRGITPKYELVQIEGAIHEPIFRYRVFLSSEFVATGTGKSKKEAKHAAAKNLLDLLTGKPPPEEGDVTNGSPTPATDRTTQVVSPYDDKVMGNPIGWLQEMCMSRRWPPPSYDMVHEEGLPHERQFTIACEVLKHREVGAGKSKKLAKRVAAHKMWQTLQYIPVETTPPGGNSQATVDEEDDLSRVLHRYAGLKDSKIPTMNPSQLATIKVSQFHKSLKQNGGPKLRALQTATLRITDDGALIKFLQEIAMEQQFDVTYVDIDEKSITGRFQCLIQLSTVPVAVCFGSGKNPKEAQIGAALNALEYLKIMSKK